MAYSTASRITIEKDKVDYVVEIFRPGFSYGGIQAEALALNILYSLLPSLTDSQNRWISRLVKWTSEQQVVFRAQAVTKAEYVENLRALRDWEGNEEKKELCEFFEQEMPSSVWAVEVSTPQLFPANERKLGEIVLDATQELNMHDESSINDVFLFARLPGFYLLGGDISNGSPQFTPISSSLLSHTELMKF